MQALTISRDAFNRLTPAEQSAHFRNGGKLSNHSTPEETPRLAILTRSQFARLSHKDRSDYCRFGGLVRDDNQPPPTPRATQPTKPKQPISYSDDE